MRSAPAYQLGGLPHLRLGVTTGHGEDVRIFVVTTEPDGAARRAASALGFTSFARHCFQGWVSDILPT